MWRLDHLSTKSMCHFGSRISGRIHQERNPPCCRWKQQPSCLILTVTSYYYWTTWSTSNYMLPFRDGIFAARYPDGAEIVHDYLFNRIQIKKYDPESALMWTQFRHASESHIPNELLAVEGNVSLNRTEEDRKTLRRSFAMLEVACNLWIRHTTSLREIGAI